MMRGPGFQFSCVALLGVYVAALAMVAPVSAGDVDAAQAILDAMRQERAKVENIRCRVDLVKWTSLEWRRDVASATREYSLHRHEFVLDDQERFRVEFLQGTCDPNGTLLSRGSVRTNTWDGAVFMGFHPGEVMTGQIRTTPQRRNRLDNIVPGAAFDGLFYGMLEGALRDDEHEVYIRSEGGKYRVEIIWAQGKAKEIALVDPLQGYTISHWESTAGGQKMRTIDVTFREVLPGIWFPVEGVAFGGTREKPAWKDTVKVTAVTINDPNLGDAPFRIAFPRGTHVYDARTRVNYVVGNPLREPEADIQLPSIVHEVE